MTNLKTVSAACQNALPEMLIDYLWHMAEESDAEYQTFVLSVRYVGDDAVQDILHRRNRYSSWHRIFGYRPVDATVAVHLSDAGAAMTLVPKAMAMVSQRKEEAVCSA